MTEKDIKTKTVFSQAYQGSALFDKEILSHILGSCKITGTTTNYAKGNEDAKKAKIDDIQDYGQYTVNGDPIRFFDVTLNDLCNITHARVNIQLVLRKLWKDNYSGMVLVFHYASTSQRADKDTWRFSWVERKTSDTTTTPGKRYTYLCGPAYSCRTIAERFDVLQKTDDKTLDSITAAFDVEALSKDFFREYKIFYDDIIQWITGTRFVGEESTDRITQSDNPDLFKESTGLYVSFAEKCKAVYSKDWPKLTADEQTEKTEKFIRDWVKKLLGRLVFLQFIQKKRWLGIDERAADWSSGKENFLLEQFNSLPCDKNFLKDELYDILFSSLNKADDVDCSGVKITKRGGVKYPFLNGGLFDDTDEVRIELPNEFFHNENHCKARTLPKKGYRETEDDFFSTCGILDFFNHYNFTIDENATDDDEMGEVGIDPEMLSKVFENLLEDNKEKGAFYTPKEIVSYMCKESLIAYLNTKVTGFDADMRTFVETVELPQSLQCETENMKAALQNVKICDPAVGSGAFPMGLLNLILKLRLSLNDDSCCDVVDKKYDYYSLVSAIRKAEDGVDEENAAKTEKEKLSRIKCAIKKNIIQNNIYGIDIEKGAVDLARLRFWLNIVVDEERPTPLPNLDFKIMQGNSLLEQYEGIDLTKLATMKIRRKCEVRCDLFGDIDGVENDVLYVPDEYVKFNLQEELDRYFDISEPEEKKTAREHIEKYIHCVVCSTLQVQVVEKQQALTRIDQESATLTPRQQKIKTKLEAEKQTLDAAIENLDDVINDKFFLWHTWFADVFGNGGFDIVIGNPPYNGISQNMEPAITAMIEDYKKEPISESPLKERKQWLQDDYVKFIRIIESFIEKTSQGMLFFITNNGYIDNPTFRGMRWHLRKSFDEICVLNLHGNARKNDSVRLGEKDENVFNIMQGVCISKFIKYSIINQHRELAEIKYGGISGQKSYKLNLLASNHKFNYSKVDISDDDSMQYFIQNNNSNEIEIEYKQGICIKDIFKENNTGITTSRDALVIGFTKDEVNTKILDFYNPKNTDVQVREKYFKKTSNKYERGDTRGWILSEVRKKGVSEDYDRHIIPLDFRVLDHRFVYYSKDVVDWGREEFYKKVFGAINSNFCLVVPRQTSKQWHHVFVTNMVSNFNYLATGGQNGAGFLFPIYMYDDNQVIIENINEEIKNKIASIIGRPDERPVTSLEVFDYIYGRLHSVSYREKYDEFLRKDFPYIPIPQDEKTFKKYMEFGRDLRECHLHMHNTKYKDDYFVGNGSNIIEKIQYKNYSVYINDNQYFRISQDVWEFQIGDDKPIQRWLKQRNKRLLSESDIRYFNEIISIIT